MMNILFVLLTFIHSRGPRTIHIDPNYDGDCFETPCAMKTATLIVRAADTVIFPPTVIRPNNYPSEFSDLFIQLTLMNTTVISKGTVVDGTYLAGDMLFQVTSHPVYTWTIFHNWTFRHFSKPIFTRQYTWSTGPFLIFRDCVFEDCQYDLFIMKGGTIFFENCQFKNISGRPIKAVSELRVDFTDCIFESTQALFFHGSDASFVNCKFSNIKGQRGGAIYTAKSTLFVNRCSFSNCLAEANGGAIYIRESSENFETEIQDSCFIHNHAKINGSDIYVYLSRIELSGENCFTQSFEESVYSFSSEVSIQNNKSVIIDDKCFDCLKKKPAEVLENDYTPTDTNKWYQFDDLKPGTTIQLDEEEDEDDDNF